MTRTEAVARRLYADLTLAVSLVDEDAWQLALTQIQTPGSLRQRKVIQRQADAVVDHYSQYGVPGEQRENELTASPVI